MAQVARLTAAVTEDIARSGPARSADGGGRRHGDGTSGEATGRLPRGI